MADQVNFPDIYLDESVAPGGVGSLADPYSDFSEINWTTGGDNSIFDWRERLIAGKQCNGIGRCGFCCTVFTLYNASWQIRRPLQQTKYCHLDQDR